MSQTKPNPTTFPWQHLPHPGKVYGAATVGERGQVVIPADARRDLGIEPGDKVMVFGNRVNGSLALIKADVFEGFADFFMTKLAKLGETAQSFFEAFTAEGVDDDAGTDDAAAASTEASPSADDADDATSPRPAGAAPKPTGIPDNQAQSPASDAGTNPADA